MFKTIFWLQKLNYCNYLNNLTGFWILIPQFIKKCDFWIKILFEWNIPRIQCKSGNQFPEGGTVGEEMRSCRPGPVAFKRFAKMCGWHEIFCAKSSYWTWEHHLQQNLLTPRVQNAVCYYPKNTARWGYIAISFATEAY